MEQKKYYYIMNFLFSLGITGIASQIPYFAVERFQATSLEISYIVGSVWVSYCVLAPLMGHLGHVIGRSHMLTAACICTFVTGWIPFFAPNIHWLYGYGLACAFSVSLFYPNMIGMMGQPGSTRAISRRIGLFNIGWAVPLMIAPVIAGHLLDAFRTVGRANITFPVMGLFAIAAAITSLKIHRPNKETKQPESEQVPLEPADARRLPAGGLMFLLLAWFSLLMVRSSVGIIYALFPRHGYNMGFSAAMVGWLLCVLAIFQGIIFWGMSRMHFWHFRQSAFYAASAIMIVGMALLCVVREFLPLLGIFALFGLAGGISYNLSIFYSLIVARNKGRAGGIHEGMLTLGNVIAVYSAGKYEHLIGRQSAPYQVGIFLSLIFLLVIIMTSLVMKIKKPA